MRVERAPCGACGSPLTSAERREDAGRGLLRVYTECSRCRTRATVRLTTARAEGLRERRAMLLARKMREIDRYGAARQRTEERLDEVDSWLREELLTAGL